MGYKVKFRQGSPRGKVLGEIGGANGFTTKKLALKQAQALADLGYIEDGILVTVEKVGGAKKKNPSSRSYKGHKIKGKTGKYTVEPYGYEFPTLKAAKGWLDKHVRDAYPKPKKATKRRKNTGRKKNWGMGSALDAEKPVVLIFSTKEKANAFKKSLDKNEVRGKFSTRKTKGWKTYSLIFTPFAFSDSAAIMKYYRPEHRHYLDIAADVSDTRPRLRNPLRSGQKFVIVDTLVPGGKWVDNIIHDGAAKADRKAQKLRAKRSQSVWKKRPHDAGYQVIDALWYGPSADRLRVGGMIGNPKRNPPTKFKVGDKVEFTPSAKRERWLPEFEKKYRADRGDSEPIYTYGEVVKVQPSWQDGGIAHRTDYMVAFFDPIEGEGMFAADEKDLRKCRKTNKNPKRNKPMITREGKLGGPGYTKRTAKARHALLNKCVQGYGYRSCLGSLQVLLLNSEMGKTARKVILTDKNWLKKKYGGPGSFGPRKR